MATNRRHLKRHSMPISWPLARKEATFVTAPNSGSFKRDYVVPLIVVLRDYLKYVKNKKEANYVVHNSLVYVNGKEVDDVRHACGMFDLIEFPTSQEKFVILFNEFGRMKMVSVDDNNLYLRVKNKRVVKGGEKQLNFENGYNLKVDDKTFSSVSVTDTVVYDVKEKKVVNTVPLKKGSYVYIFDGKFKGRLGKVSSIEKFNGLARDVAEVEIEGESRSTAKEYCFAVGTKKEDLKRFE